MPQGLDSPHLRRYDLTFRRLIDIIVEMDADERGLLLKEAERINAKLRGARRQCHIPVQLDKADGLYPAVVRNLSFRGAFLDCKMPVSIGEAVLVRFNNDEPGKGLMMRATIVHATAWGIGIHFDRIDSRAARFIQKSMDAG